MHRTAAAAVAVAAVSAVLIGLGAGMSSTELEVMKEYGAARVDFRDYQRFLSMHRHLEDRRAEDIRQGLGSSRYDAQLTDIMRILREKLVAIHHAETNLLRIEKEAPGTIGSIRTPGTGPWTGHFFNWWQTDESRMPTNDTSGDWLK